MSYAKDKARSISARGIVLPAGLEGWRKVGASRPDAFLWVDPSQNCGGRTNTTMNGSNCMRSAVILRSAAKNRTKIAFLWYQYQNTFCPARYSWDCPYFVNECCSDYDCEENQLCCEENCGNTCQFYSSYPTNGHRVEYYSYCRVDPRFTPPPHMPPP
ncbi:WAP domain-containing protein [Caerostris extrusa]|uniref:WAP domain-containing protein n=1 Tax=Caerostris extrusa TaxID=172846 RepID=A0AAV4WA84_CAEEX|nr:WAP domain-containing protein [Caerostris extrusa]